MGADGESGVKTRVEPSLQVAPGVYNDTILAGLDYFMNELRKRDMTAVLYLNNSLGMEWRLLHVFAMVGTWQSRRYWQRWLAGLYEIRETVSSIGQREGFVCQLRQEYRHKNK